MLLHIDLSNNYCEQELAIKLMWRFRITDSDSLKRLSLLTTIVAANIIINDYFSRYWRYCYYYYYLIKFYSIKASDMNFRTRMEILYLTKMKRTVVIVNAITTTTITIIIIIIERNYYYYYYCCYC